MQPVTVQPPVDEAANEVEEASPDPVSGPLPTPLPETATRFVPPAPQPRPELNAGAAIGAATIDGTEPIASSAPVEALNSSDAPHFSDAPCLAQLTALAATFEPVGPVDGEGLCGITGAVRLSAIGDVRLQPEALLACPTAVRFAEFATSSLAPIAQEHLGAAPQVVHVAASYICRTRNNQPDARMSEHSFGRAIDVRAITFDDGQEWAVQPLHESRSHARFQGQLREAACGPFKTVLGPGSDGFHGDHIHFDLAQRTSTYCR